MELGERAGLDGETLRTYESGARQPSRESLERILEVLQVPYGTAHEAMLDRGFHHPDTRFETDPVPTYYFTIPEMREFVDGVPWPMFTANELGELAVANQPAQSLWQVDLDAELNARPRARANLFVAMAEKGILERLVNWDELLREFIALYKAVPASQTMLDAPGPLFTEIVAAFAAASPASLMRLLEMWQSTPARTDKARWAYPVVWREPGFPDIHFRGMVSQASEPLAIGFNEWIPVDAASFATFEAVIAARGAAPAPRDARGRGQARSQRR